MKKKILVIDDERVIRDSIQKILERENYTVETVANIRDAVDKVAFSDYDLITCDVMIPALGGFELIDQIKADPNKKNIPILMITGVDKDILAMTRHEADEVITKPFESKELIEKVNKLLAESATVEG